MGRFWSELKRRNVVRVGIAYCAAGWVVIQIAAVLFPLYDAPPWILKVVTTLVLLGLPLALVFAWAFELTPQGLQRTDDVPREVSATRRTGRPLDFLIIGVLAVAVALFVLDKFVWHTGSPAVQAPAATALRWGSAADSRRHAQFDRRTALRQHEQRSGAGIFLRRHN